MTVAPPTTLAPTEAQDPAAAPLRVEGLAVGHQGRVVQRDLTFTLRRGEVLAFAC